MKIYRISGTTGTSTILIGERLQNMTAHLPNQKPIIITDGNVGRLYAEKFPPAPVITLEPGELSKSLATIDRIYDRLLELEADRSSFIVGIGGGVVCDITGFVASTFMRGLRFGYVATSLLAQVDASVGGKNGVNYGGYKNLVGTFNQPEFVICDPQLLKTLPEKEVLCGLAEVVKHALIKDPALLAFLEQNSDGILRLAAGDIERLVSDSVTIKSTVVNQDERESGLRRILNFGHTFGHAVEHLQRISHGEAVSIGMVIAADISMRKGMLTANDVDRIKQLLERLKLPTAPAADPARMIDAVRKDKKRENDIVHFVLLDGIGQAVVEALPLADLEGYIEKGLGVHEEKRSI
jgi:3-dehydroquinate synthase